MGGRQITRFEDLECWQEARKLVAFVYRLSGRGRTGNDFAIKDQLRRAALSVMNNIAEGFARYSRKDFIRFLTIAQASGAEVQSMSYILRDLEYIDDEKFNALTSMTERTRRLISGLIRYLVKNNA